LWVSRDIKIPRSVYLPSSFRHVTSYHPALLVAPLSCLMTSTRSGWDQ